MTILILVLLFLAVVNWQLAKQQVETNMDERVLAVLASGIGCEVEDMQERGGNGQRSYEDGESSKAYQEYVGYMVRRGLNHRTGRKLK